MNISVKGDYALKALFYLAQRGGAQPVRIAEIAASQEIPQKFLELILAQLKQGGFVQSRRGAEGGYLLARPPQTIMVGEALRFMEGALTPSHRARRGRRPADENPFTDLWRQVDRAVSDIVDRTSFAELAARWTEKQSRFVANWEI